MIDKGKLRGLLLKDDPWGTIRAPESFEIRIQEEDPGKKPSWRFFSAPVIRYAAAALLVLITGTALFLTYPRGEKVVIQYPYHGETSVELIGSMNRWNKKIPMKLDRDKRSWVAEIRVPRKGIYEYQFIIDRLFYSAGTADYKVKDRYGNEKAILILAQDGKAGPFGPVSVKFKKSDHEV